MATWKEISDTHYAVSDDGAVINTNTGYRLNPYSHLGYLFVNLSNGNNRVRMSVHRLVAEAFIPNVESKPTVNHINEVKTDNRVANLEWATHLEQNVHGTRIARAVSHTDYKARQIDYAAVAAKHDYKKMAEKMQIPVNQYRKDGTLVAKYAGVIAAAKAINGSAGQISSCCRGYYGRKTHKGYRWEYSR